METSFLKATLQEELLEHAESKSNRLFIMGIFASIIIIFLTLSVFYMYLQNAPNG